jgi:GNAT superfamily N-acetyltransferase
VWKARDEIIERSQRWLEDEGYPELLTVYRGGRPRGDVVPVTLDPRVAQRHASRWGTFPEGKGQVVYTYEVPRSHVLAVVDLFQREFEERELLVPRRSLQELARYRANPIEIKSECVGAHSGQVDCVVWAVLDGKPVGEVQYCLFEDEIHIGFVQVAEGARRRGVATRLIQELSRLHPGAPIRPGYLTESGQAFVAGLPESLDRLTPNGGALVELLLEAHERAVAERGTMYVWEGRIAAFLPPVRLDPRITFYSVTPDGRVYARVGPREQALVARIRDGGMELYEP